MLDPQPPPVPAAEGVMPLVEIVGAHLRLDAPVPDLAAGNPRLHELAPVLAEEGVAVGEADGRIEPENQRAVQLLGPPAEVRVDEAGPEKHLAPVAVPQSEDGIREDVPPLAHL